MSETTKSDKSVKVINDGRESELLACFKTLHHITLQALTEVGIKATFPDNFAKCGSVDLKNLHEQSRILMSDKKKARFESRVAGIRASVQSVVDTYMVKKGKAKAQFDALPEELRAEGVTFNPNVVINLKELVGCFPAGTNEGDMVRDLKGIGYTVNNNEERGNFIKVTYTAPKVAEAAPESGNVVKAA